MLIILALEHFQEYFEWYTLFYRKLRSGLSTESFLVFCDFEYEKFLNCFLTFFFNIEQPTEQKENTV